jgi:site-specific recombinase XerD
MHQSIHDFIAHLRASGRESTAAGYQHTLRFYDTWLRSRQLDPLRVTTDHLRSYQRWLAEEYRSANGKPLGLGTQATRIAVVKSYCSWLEQRGLVVQDVSAPVKLPPKPAGMVRRDYLSQQEAIELLQTQARHTKRYTEGSSLWAREVQALALLCTALATGRRRTALRNLTLSCVDLDRNELRYERDKGKPGRVNPVAPWCMSILKIHIERARPILNPHADNQALFVGRTTPRLGANSIAKIIDEAWRRVVTENADLKEMATKRITPHSLRVSFATLLFNGGCNIRSINELMSHDSLSQTAAYTPQQVEDLRRVCRKAHPRA